MYAKKISKRKIYWFNVSIIGIILGLSLQMAYAWVAPVKPAPSQEVGAPLNTSLAEQTKEGNLNVGGKLSVKEICINTDCKTSWPGTPAPAPVVSTGTKTFSTAGQTSTWDVPAGIGVLHVQMWGGGGGGAVGVGSDVNYNGEWTGASFFTGGGGGASGGYVTADIPVTPGQRVWVYTGKAGKGSTALHPYSHQIWNSPQEFGGSGEKSWLIVGDPSIDINSYVSQKKFTMYAEGGSGGENYSAQSNLTWLWNIGTPPFYFPNWKDYTSNSYYCGGGGLSIGGGASGPNGSRTIKGNNGGACDNLNADTAGGAAIMDSTKNTFAFGAGGGGVGYGTIPLWNCTTFAGCDVNGYCWPDTITTLPYDDGADYGVGNCVNVQADGHLTQKAKDGGSGNIIISW